jgi:hypothetical protein
MITEPDVDPAVVVAGDALIDLTPTTTVRGHLAYEPHPGGSCSTLRLVWGAWGAHGISGEAVHRCLRPDAPHPAC